MNVHGADSPGHASIDAGPRLRRWMRPIDLSLAGVIHPQVRPTPAISTADLVTLVNSVSAHADQTPLPPIRTYLPRGFTDGTQRYAPGTGWHF